MKTLFIQWAKRLISQVHGLWHYRPARLAVVRRYVDANGSYVGELYVADHNEYRMVGMSLDTLPLALVGCNDAGTHLDLWDDFLAPMLSSKLRVGAAVPRDNYRVQQMIASLPKRGMKLTIQNRFMDAI